jgi:hypothetical protein
MSRRSNAARRRLDRETAFVAALDGYQKGGSSEALLHAASAVIDSKKPIAPEHADTISVLTDNLNIAGDLRGRSACGQALARRDGGPGGRR